MHSSTRTTATSLRSSEHAPEYSCSQGLARRMCWKLLSPLGLKVTAAFALIGAVALGVALIRTVLGILKLIAPSSLARHFESFDVRSPLHRFASRTSLLEAVLDELLFGGACDERTPGLSLILSSMPPNPEPVRPSGSEPRNWALGVGVNCIETMCRSRMPSPLRPRTRCFFRPSTNCSHSTKRAAPYEPSV